jgi:hypothetical protein
VNNEFAEQEIENHFEDIRNFKGNIMQVLKMVDNFMQEFEKKLEEQLNKYS